MMRRNELELELPNNEPVNRCERRETQRGTTRSVLFAKEYKSCEAETANIMLVTTLGMLVALPTGVALSAYL
jgi:hypothetical protein